MKRDLAKPFQKFLPCRGFYRVPLRAVLVLPFVLQAILTVTIVSHLSYQHGLRSAGQAQATQTLTKATHQVQSAFQLNGSKFPSAAAIDLGSEVERADLKLSVNAILQTLRLDDAIQVWILDRSGNVLGHAPSRPPKTGLDFTPHRSERPDKTLRLRNVQATSFSAETLIHDLTQHIGDLTMLQETIQFQVEAGSDRQFIQVQPLGNRNGWDLLMLLSTSEPDWITASLIHNRQTLRFSLVALVVAIMTGLLTTQWIIHPIQSLTDAARRLAQGDFNHLPNIRHRADELGELAKTFKLMADQLQRSFTELQTLNDALADSGSRLLQFLDVLPIGVAVHAADGQVVYLNQVAKDLLGLPDWPAAAPDQPTVPYHLFPINGSTPYPPEEMPAYLALKGETSVLKGVEAHHCDRAIPLEVHAMPIYDSLSAVSYAVVVFQDVSEQFQAECLLADYNRILETQVRERTAALENSQRQNRAIISAIPDLMFRLDRDGFYLEYVQAHATLDLVPADVDPVGHHLSEYLSPEHTQQYLYHLAQALESGKLQIFERSLSVNGCWYHEEVRVAPSSDRQALCIVRDISDRRRTEDALKQANQELQQLATLDSLTQVANRRRFDEYLAYEWRRLAREQQPIALILADVDFFKRYNDYYGHQAGDRCLQKVAQTLANIIRRPADIVARYGGEEFAIVLPLTDLNGAIAVAQSIQHKFQQIQIPHAGSEVQPYITLSLGIACQIPQPNNNAEILICEADAALYQAKRQGRNQRCTIADATYHNLSSG